MSLFNILRYFATDKTDIKAVQEVVGSGFDNPLSLMINDYHSNHFNPVFDLITGANLIHQNDSSSSFYDNEFQDACAWSDPLLEVDSVTQDFIYGTNFSGMNPVSHHDDANFHQPDMIDDVQMGGLDDPYNTFGNDAFGNDAFGNDDF